MPRRYGNSGGYPAGPQGSLYFAPNRTAVMGSGIMDGLNKGLQNYANMKMQAMKIQAMQQQNQARMVQAQGMAQWRQAQAEKARQDSMGASAADINLLQAMAQHGKIAPSVLSSALKPRIDQFLAAAKPEEKTALANHINQQVAQGQIPSEIGSNINFAPKTLDLYGKMAGNQTKVDTQNLRNQGALDKQGLANQGAVARENVRGGYSLQRADIYGSYKTKDEAMKDTTAQLNQTAKSLSPNNPLAANMAPETKALLQQRFNDLHDTYHQISNSDPSQFGRSGGARASAPAGQAPAGGGPAAAPQAPAQAKPLSWDQRGQAKVGDQVAAPNGQMLVVGGRDQNGKVLFKPPGDGQAAGQAAPAAPGLPPVPQGAQMGAPIQTPAGAAPADAIPVNLGQ